MVSACARTLWFFCASAAPRAFGPGRLAFLCGWSRAEVEEGLRDLARRGRLARDGEGAWFCPRPGADAPLPEAGRYGTPFLDYYTGLSEGRHLDAVDGLLRWAESLRSGRRAWARDFALEEMVEALVHTPMRDCDEAGGARYLELSLRAQALADFQYRDPRRMRLLLLRARGVARMIRNDNYLYLVNTILDVQAILYRNGGGADPAGPRRGPEPAAAAPAGGAALLGAAPYLSMVHYLQGNTRQALDHFSLASGPCGPRTETGNTGAFATAFAALAAALFGDYPLAVSMLRAGIRRHQRAAACPARSWLRMHLATVYLAAGRPDAALEHVDAALTGSSLAESVQSWVGARIALAHYHVLGDRPAAARRILARTAEQARARGYTWRYNSPYFLDMLYAFRCAGLPDIPEYPLDEELTLCLEGGNRMLRAVAQRIRGDMLSRGGAPLREALSPLLRSRAFFRMQQMPGEKCKTCAVLAGACLRRGDRPRALRYALEAWPGYEQFRYLTAYRSPELLELLPEPRGGGEGGVAGRGDDVERDFFKALLELDPREKEFFPAEMLKAVAGVFGAARACLFEADPDGRPRVVRTHHLGHEQIFGKDGAFPLHLVREALEGVPIAVTRDALDEDASGGEGGWYLYCLPVPLASGRACALYLDGDEPSDDGDPDPEARLVRYGEWLGVLLTRHETCAGRTADRSVPVSPSAAFFPTPEEQRAIIYQSEAMRALLRRVDKAAESTASVLVYGESGVGKELVARRIHQRSGRPGPFVALNLSSLPEELFESEMQGHERGAFTGAFQKKIGLLEMADRGTLFIDEVPDVSPRIQVKLLRLLQERSFMRVGGTRLLRSDFRLIVATNRDLFQDVREGRFRSDLFYRLCVVPLTIPPLRERPEDVDALARHYLEYFAVLHGRPVPALSEEDGRRLRAYAWPGNIRELKNVMERAVLFADQGRPSLFFDSEGFGRPTAANPVGPPPAGEVMFGPITTHDPTALPNVSDAIGHVLAGMPTIRDLEAQYIASVLRMTGGKVSGKNGAAAILGLTRSTLYDKMRALDIDPPRNG